MGLTLSVSSYVVLHFYTYFFEIKGLLLLLSISGLSTLVFTFLLLPFKESKLPLFLVFIALLVLVFTNDSVWTGMVEGVKQMRSLVGLLLIVPMISWVLKEEPYIEEIMNVAHGLLNNSRKFYFGLLTMTQVIAYFLLFGSIPMMYQFIHSFLKNHKGEVWENYKGTAVLRGFALSTLWVISIPSFIFAMETLEVATWKAILQGFSFALCGTILATVFSFFQERKYGIDLTALLKNEVDKAIKKSRNKGKWNKEVLEFILLFVTLFGTIFLVHIIFELELLVAIPLVIFVWSGLYFLLKKRGKSLIIESKQYVSQGIAKQSQQFSIIIAAGLLIYSINQSDLGGYLINGMHFLTEMIPLLNSLFLIPLIVVLLGFLGLGPLPAVVLVAGIVNSMALPYPPELTFLAVTSGSVLTTLLSPIILPVIMLSSNNGLSGMKNGIHFNLKFAIVFYCMVQLYLQIMIQI